MPDIQSEIARRADIFIQMYVRSLSDLLTKDYAVVDTRTPDYENDTKIGHEVLKTRNIIAVVRVKIVNVYNQIIGYLGIDFCKEPKEGQIEQGIERLKAAAVELGALLSAKS